MTVLVAYLLDVWDGLSSRTEIVTVFTVTHSIMAGSKGKEVSAHVGSSSASTHGMVSPLVVNSSPCSPCLHRFHRVFTLLQ